jgi:hypothetical protein
MLVIALPVLLELRKARLNLLEPVLLFNFGFFASYCFKGLLIKWDADLFITYPERWTDPPDLFPYFLISWAAILMFNIGYYLRPSAFSVTPREKTVGSSANYRLLFLMLIILSVLSAVNIISRIDFDFSSLLYSVDAWEGLRASVMFAWLDGGYAYILPLYVGFFHLAYEIHARPGRRAERWAAAVLTLFVMMIIGGRAYMLAWILSLVIYRSIWVKEIQLWKQAAGLSILVVAGGALGILQKITTVGAKALEYDFPINLFYRLSSSYEQFENLVNMLNAQFSLDWGYSIFQDIFVTYAPRFLFPSKPLDYGFMRVQTILFDDIWSVSRDTTYPVGSLAELYFNLGYAGIFVGMLILGAIVSWLRAVAFRNNPNYVATFCMLGASFLAPHRWYGCVLLTLFVYLGLETLNSLLVWFSKAIGKSANTFGASESTA